jgi:glutamine amidotransferase
LANNGIENGLTSGLGLIDGEIIELQATNLRVPHVGFNEIAPQKEHTIFNNISENPDFYFTHSFKFNAKFEQEIICTTHYGENFVSGVNKNNIYGFQFHPEKSQFNGLKLLSNFCSKL